MKILQSAVLAVALIGALLPTSASAGPNIAPVISGTPATSVVAGTRYTFRATATDANGDRIRFYMYNKPSWGSFSRYSGEFTGVPPAGLNQTFSNIVVRATDGRLWSSLPAFSIRVTSTSTNAAPKISGSPATSVAAGAAYNFQPTASDANGDALSFSIQSKPSWANFSIATGRLSGTAPAAASTSSGIVISVSDGRLSAALPAFSINVSTATSGTASLNWAAPTQNTDGSALTNLAGYRLYFGSSPSSLTQTQTIASAASTSYLVSNLSSGTWYFALSAYTTTGIESALSAVGSKLIP